MSSSACRHVRHALRDQGDAPWVREHLRTCAACRRFAETAALLEDIAPAVRPPDPSPFWVRRWVHAASRGVGPRRRMRPNVRVALIAAAAAAVAAAVAAVGTRRLVTQDAARIGDAPAALVRAVAAPSQHVGSEWIVVARGPVRTAQGDRIEGDDRARVQLRAEGDGSVVVQLRDGLAVFTVAPRSFGARFRVVTPQVEVVVVGTRFAVDARSSTVTVLEGTVWVWSGADAGSAVVHAGQKVTAGKVEPVTPGDLAALDPWVPDGAACAQPRPVAGAGVQRAAAKDEPKSAGAGNRRRVARMIAANHLEEARKTAVDLYRRTKAPYVPGLLADIARAFRQQRRWDEAREVYEQLITQFARTPEGLTALVALGQMELFQMGRSRSAYGRFSTYLQRAPNGYLRDEALLGRAVSAARIGRWEAVVKDMGTLLAESPAMVHEDMVRTYIGALVHLGRCDAAQDAWTRWGGRREDGAWQSVHAWMQRCASGHAP